jgi:hypothetical protein
MTTLYHGGHSGFTIHEGQCFTDDVDVALAYTQGSDDSRLAVVSLDLRALIVEDCEGYDHDENDCPADSHAYRSAAAARGVDVLRYEDEDDRGRAITCWRVVSDKALAAIEVREVLTYEDADDRWG